MNDNFIEVDAETARALYFAAQISNTTPGRVVEQLVRQASIGSNPVPAGDRVQIAAKYAGSVTEGVFDRTTNRVIITSGPLTNSEYTSPTGAAMAVVAQRNPNVKPQRNGWRFWHLDDGTGRQLGVLRPPTGGSGR